MNRYNLTARVFPMLLFYLPVLSLAILFSVEIEKKIHVLTSFGLIAALSYFNAQLGRKGGKEREANLWVSWGGPPTTQLLRWADQRLDVNTKKRYHFKLQALCPVQPFPTAAVEAGDRDGADAAYAGWIRFLISQTRDTKKFDLLFSENINYGFWRNLWGLKRAALMIILLLAAGVYLYFSFINQGLNPLNFDRLFFIAEGILVFIALLWAFIVTENSIKIPAFAYAERLLEATNSL